MPKKVEECVEELKRDGYSESEAWAICMDKHGVRDRAGSSAFGFIRNVIVALLLLALSAAIGFSAAAQPTPDYAIATAASEHYVEGNFNETNPGVLVGYEMGEAEGLDISFISGAFQNSFNKTSAVAGLRASYAPFQYLHLNIASGVATGYGEASLLNFAPSGTVPMFVQSIEVGLPEFQATVLHLPAAIGFGITTHF